MSNLKQKIPTFIYGLLIGLVIAGSFFILKFDHYFKKSNFTQMVSTHNNDETKNSNTITDNKIETR